MFTVTIMYITEVNHNYTLMSRLRYKCFFSLAGDVCQYLCVLAGFLFGKGDAVGFIGLGNMGSHMAQNLLKKGYQVIAYDLSLEAMKTVTEAGKKSSCV